MKRNTWLRIALCSLLVLPLACAGAKKAGLDVNNGFETAVVAVETGLFEWPKSAADPSATSTTGETSIGLVGPGPQAIPIGTCQFHTSAAMSVDAANYATITVFKRTNGGDASTLASLNATSSWTAFTNVGIPLNDAGPMYVSPGDSITVSIGKTGAGGIVPQGQLACFTTIN